MDISSISLGEVRLFPGLTLAKMHLCNMFGRAFLFRSIHQSVISCHPAHIRSYPHGWRWYSLVSQLDTLHDQTVSNRLKTHQSQTSLLWQWRQIFVNVLFLKVKTLSNSQNCHIFLWDVLSISHWSTHTWRINSI